MESQDQAMAPTLQTRRARREAALAALESSPVTMSVPDSSVPGAVRTPAPHAAPSRPDGTFPPALDAHREPPVSPLRTTSGPRMTGPAPHAALGRPAQRAAAPHASSPSVVADPASLARLAAFSEIAELRRARESRTRDLAPAAHQSTPRSSAASRPGVAAAARPAVPQPVVVPSLEPDEQPVAVRPAAPVTQSRPTAPAAAPLARPQVAATLAQPVLPDPVAATPASRSLAAPVLAATTPAAATTSGVPAGPLDAPAEMLGDQAGTSSAAACAPMSRRATVEARRAAAGKKPRSAGSSFHRPAGRAHKGGWVARAGILAALGITTIAMPLANASQQGASATSVPLVAEGRSTLDVITSSSSSAAATEAVIVAEGGTLAGRDAAVASRGSARDTLAGCDLSQPVRGANGRLGSEELCDLSQSGHRQQPYAAVAFDALNEAYRAKFGADICLTDSYRSLQGQYSVARSKPGLSARPGTSQHGLGLAVDLCPTSYTSTARWNWLKANGPTYGWDNPAWARSGGSGKYEPWHWEYFPLVEY